MNSFSLQSSPLSLSIKSKQREERMPKEKTQKATKNIEWKKLVRPWEGSANNKYYSIKERVRKREGKERKKILQNQFALSLVLAFLAFAFINFQIFLFLSTKNVLSTTKATRLLAGSGLSLHLSLLSFLPSSTFVRLPQKFSVYLLFFQIFLVFS